jgi:hypothetical protein
VCSVCTQPGPVLAIVVFAWSRICRNKASQWGTHLLSSAEQGACQASQPAALTLCWEQSKGLVRQRKTDNKWGALTFCQVQSKGVVRQRKKMMSKVHLRSVTIMDLWTATYVFTSYHFDPDSLPTHSDCHEVAYAYWSTHLCLLTVWLICLLMLCRAYWYYQAWVSILTVRLVITTYLLTDPLRDDSCPNGLYYI